MHLSVCPFESVAQLSVLCCTLPEIVLQFVVVVDAPLIFDELGSQLIGHAFQFHATTAYGTIGQRSAATR